MTEQIWISIVLCISSYNFYTPTIYEKGAEVIRMICTFMGEKNFIEGVNTLEKFGYHFEINVNHTQMDIVREFVKHIPEVQMILDHCGKPGIEEGALQQYQEDVAELSQHPNLWIKLSDLPVEADHRNWNDSDLRPYIDSTIEAFGFDRTIYAGDYPICLQATTLSRWVDVLDRAFAGCSKEEIRKFYRENANSFYRLGL